jgi:hypothetical protein
MGKILVGTFSTGNVLDPSMLALDQGSLERRSLARNEVLFRQGDKVRAIYFIEEGRLRLKKSPPRVIAELVPGRGSSYLIGVAWWETTSQRPSFLIPLQ